MLLKFSIALLTLSISLTSAAKEKNDQSKLFLVGGGLKTCSSMSQKNCKTSQQFSENDKSKALYQLSQKNIELLFQHWPQSHLSKQRKALEKLLHRMYKRDNALLTKSELRALWKKSGGTSLVNQLADKEFYLMLDALEVAQMSSQGKRVTERVSLEQTKNLFSKDIFNKFNKLAGKKAIAKGKNKASILVVTASARDPYEALDFYLNVFAQTGADVTWLPVDAALSSLWQQQGHSQQACEKLASYQSTVLSTIKRSAVYPDYFLAQQTLCQQPEQFIQLIEQADGLFINGGDQSLTRQAFKQFDGSDSKLLTAIRKQVEGNDLIVGGTSAGTAVMSGGNFQGKSIPMITNGRSEAALMRGAKKDVLPNAGCHKANQCEQGALNDDLTYQSAGGLGLFSWGVMDTHFSERGRQGRLVKLTLDTNTNYAFGVDEATALQVSWQGNSLPEMKVVGQSGVFVVDNHNHARQKRDKQVVTHFLTRDDHMKLTENGLSITFAAWKHKIEAGTSKIQPMSDIFDGSNYLEAVKALCLSKQANVTFTYQWQGDEREIAVDKKDNWRAAYGAVSNAETAKDYCSYTNLLFSF